MKGGFESRQLSSAIQLYTFYPGGIQSEFFLVMYQTGILTPGKPISAP
jgi:hypothetical protein